MITHRESHDERIHALARRAGVERSLYIAEAIGNALSIASDGLCALGGWLRRALPRTGRSVKQAA